MKQLLLHVVIFNHISQNAVFESNVDVLLKYLGYKQSRVIIFYSSYFSATLNIEVPAGSLLRSIHHVLERREAHIMYRTTLIKAL